MHRARAQAHSDWGVKEIRFVIYMWAKHRLTLHLMHRGGAKSQAQHILAAVQVSAPVGDHHEQRLEIESREACTRVMLPEYNAVSMQIIPLS